MSNGEDDGSDDPHHILGIAAHELKNALGPLVMTLQIFERRIGAGERIAPEELAHTRRQVRRLSQLVDDLLDVTRLDSGQLTLRTAPIDLAALVLETIESFRLGSMRAVTLLPPGADGAAPLMVDGDAVRLGEILMNLLGNAAKYSPASTAIEVAVRAGEGSVRMAVIDHGCGIAPADQARLFQRYFRAAATAQKARGLGLGLFICRAIAERHGGTMGVDSVPGQGATFWLDLPLAQLK